jgi:predicted PurR-regulated permease PerM
MQTTLPNISYNIVSLVADLGLSFLLLLMMSFQGNRIIVDFESIF